MFIYNILFYFLIIARLTLSAYNQRLSENRCRKIQMLLMDMGVPEEQMILVPVGGVKELDPTEYDRRVLIELVKEIK